MGGTFMVSLDYELFWGMLDVCPLEAYQDNVLGGKKAIPKLLQLFEKYRSAQQSRGTGIPGVPPGYFPGVYRFEACHYRQRH